MKAILINEDKSLALREVECPELRDGEIKIKVSCAAVNRADLLQREGSYPPPPGCPEWPGLEVSGEVCELSEKAARDGKWKIGDKVCALLGGGGYAEYVCVPQEMVMPIPAGISMVEAAALPEAFATAYLNLFIEGGAKAGDNLLMHAGASGLASVIIPMPSVWRVPATRGSITNPADCLLFADGAITGSDLSVSKSNGTLWNGWKEDDPKSTGIWFGHSRTANITFCDGHVEARTKESLSSDNFYAYK